MRTILLSLALNAALLTRLLPGAETPPADLPNLSHTVLICQEWHNWFYADNGADGQDAPWWGDHCWQDNNTNLYGQTDPYHPVGPLWWRATTSKVYPLIGPYASANPEIIRWQLRLMKAAGLDGTLAHLYPLPPAGQKAANLEMLERCFQLAAEEGYRLGVQDEIQFMKKEAKGEEAFVARATEVLQMMLKYPAALLTVQGQPVYQFESWGLGDLTPEALQRILERVEKNVGRPVFWMSAGPAGKLLAVPALKCLKWPSDVVSGARIQQSSGTFGQGSARWETAAPVAEWNSLRADKWAEELQKYSTLARQAGKAWCPWIYPGFEHGGYQLSREDGRHVVAAVRAAMNFRPDVINLAAWNERNEKTWLEPSWSLESADPYRYLKLIAAMKGRDFVTPPLPPKEAVDPLMWSVLYGIDRTPPAITGARLDPAGQHFALDCLDDRSGIAEARLSAAPLVTVEWKESRLTADGCTPEIKGTATAAADHLELQPGQSATLTLRLPGRAELHEAWLFARVRVPDGMTLRLQPDYPVAQPKAGYRLNQGKYPTILRAPAIFETHRDIWQPFKLAHWQPAPGAENQLTLALSVGTLADSIKRMGYPAEERPAPAGVVRLSRLVIFPATLAPNEPAAFALPSPSPLVRTMVATWPAAMESITGRPVALQCFDQAGNASAVQVVEGISDRDRWNTQVLELYQPWGNRPQY